MEIFQGNDQAITRESLYGTHSEATYAGVTSFMRRRYSRDLCGVDLVVSGVPFDTATTNRPRHPIRPPGPFARHRCRAPGNATIPGHLTPSITWP